MNGVEPYAWLKDTLEKIAAGHPNSRIDELLPWNFIPRQAESRVPFPHRLRRYGLTGHRKRIEGGLRLDEDRGASLEDRHRGLARVDWQLTLTLAAYDFIRLPKLLRAEA